MPECRICRNQSGNRGYSVREMMIGTREAFGYFECRNCGCLQIGKYPSDIAKYYSREYYSFSAVQPAARSLKAYLQKQRDLYLILGRGLIGNFVSRMRPTSVFRMFAGLHLSFHDKVLDIGCGSGHFLYRMRELGFKELTGVDPFLPDIDSPDEKIRLIKSDLAGLEGSYDLIMLHHSMEHMPDQQTQMHHIARLLAPGGVCIVRVPVCSSEAWERYGTNWASLDAPRHYYLHTPKSMGLLANGAGLEVFRLNYDSSGFQFWASELYRQDISMTEAANMNTPPFTKDQYGEFERQAELLNRQRRGDFAAFYLRIRPKMPTLDGSSAQGLLLRGSDG